MKFEKNKNKKCIGGRMKFQQTIEHRGPPHEISKTNLAQGATA